MGAWGEDREAVALPCTREAALEEVPRRSLLAHGEGAYIAGATGAKRHGMPDSRLRLAMQEMPDKGKQRGESKLAKRTPLLLATSWA